MPAEDRSCDCALRVLIDQIHTSSESLFAESEFTAMHCIPDAYIVTARKQFDMLRFACSDVGFTCGFKTEASREKELWDKIASRAKSGHGLNPEQIPADLKAEIQANIKTS